MPRLLRRLSDVGFVRWLLVLSIVLLIAGGALILYPAFVAHQNKEAVVAFVELHGGQVYYEPPEWVNRLPSRIAKRIGNYFDTVTAIDTDYADDRLMMLLRSCPNIVSLRVGYWGKRCQITDTGLQHLAALKDVRHIELHSAHVTDAGLEVFHQFDEMGFVLLITPQLTDAGLAHLSHFDKLGGLVVGSRYVTDAGLQHLSAMTELVSLDFVSCQIEGHGLRALNCADKLQSLSLLSDRFKRERIPFNDAGMAELPRFSKLRWLNLHDIAISDEGLSHIAGMRWVRRLGLSGAYTDDDGLPHLAGLTRLESLDLSRTNVTGAGVAKLVQTINSPYELRTLHNVDISGTAIGDNDVDALGKLPRLGCLRAEGTNITKAGAARIQAANPRLGILGIPEWTEADYQE